MDELSEMIDDPDKNDDLGPDWGPLINLKFLHDNFVEFNKGLLKVIETKWIAAKMLFAKKYMYI